MRAARCSKTSAPPDGLYQLQLKSGSPRAKITLKGKGPLLHVTAEPLLKDPGVTVQLVNSAGSCWDAEFSTALKNDTKQFKAKSD